MLLARLCEGSSLQLRSQGRSIAIWPSPKVGGLHDKSKDPYVGADWGLGSMVSPEHVACSSSWLFAELLMGRADGGVGTTARAAAPSNLKSHPVPCPCVPGRLSQPPAIATGPARSRSGARERGRAIGIVVGRGSQNTAPPEGRPCRHAVAPFEVRLGKPRSPGRAKPRLCQ